VVLDWYTKEILCSYDNPLGNTETERVIRTIKEELPWLNDFISFEEAESRIGSCPSLPIITRLSEIACFVEG